MHSHTVPLGHRGCHDDRVAEVAHLAPAIGVASRVARRVPQRHVDVISGVVSKTKNGGGKRVSKKKRQKTKIETKIAELEQKIAGKQARGKGTM